MAIRKKISIVTPCYNEQGNVRNCYDAVRQLFENELAEYDYEHIFCDNASRDDTVMILRGLASVDSRVKVILNSRNFGGLRSLFNGMLHTTGDATLCYLPADLQDPPEELPRMVRLWEQGYQVVYGIRDKREEGWLMQSVRRAYYRLVRQLADIEIPVNVGEFQLVDRCVIEALQKFDDYFPYIRGLIASCGFKTTGIKYTWKARKQGISNHRLYHLIDNGLNGLISCTNVPLRLCMFLGFFISGASILYGMVMLVLNLLFYRQFAAPGIPTLIVSLFFFSGCQLFFFGILGEYISAIHSQVRKRPMVIVSERINFETPDLADVASPDAKSTQQRAA